MQFGIYMLKETPSAESKLFMNYQWALSHGGVNFDEYECVYCGTVNWCPSIGMILESIFTMLNYDHPDDYRARSLSVSDIIALEGGDLWFCDSFGFKKIPTPTQKEE